MGEKDSCKLQHCFNILFIFATLRRLTGILLCVLLVGSAVAQPCSLILSGHIQDKDTKEKLSGATVFLEQLDARFVTDANGDFRYPGICPGEYTIEVTHAGCEPYHARLTVTRNLHLDILMPHLRNNLDEVIVQGQRAVPNTGYRRQVDSRELESARNYSLAEALGTINGVSLLQTGSSISKPVIHGLHGARILTINNGVRQEGQQWGNEHATEIDPYIAGELTVIKGVDELRYGSDAIGGVVLVDPRPIRSLPGYELGVNTAYFTNNRQYVVSGIFEQQLEKIPSLGYRLQGTFKKAANVNTPHYRLNNTGLQEQNFSLTTNWKKQHYRVEAYYSQFATRIGIFEGAHIGNISDLENAIAGDRPDDVYLGRKGYGIRRPNQEVLHRLFKLKPVFNRDGHKISLTLAGQYNHRKEFDIVRNSENQDPQLALAVISFSEELAYEHPAFHNLRGTVGLSFMQQDNSTSGRYLIPKYTSATYGGYWIEKWSREKLDIEAGLRLDHKSVHTTRRPYGDSLVRHEFDFLTLGSSLYFGYRLSGDLKISLNASLSTRAPYVNELLIDGVHHGAAIYEQGDRYLKPEKSQHFAAGLNYRNEGRFAAELYVYYNRINDFIHQQPLPEEPVLTIRGAFPRYVYTQTDAVLKGADLSASYKFDNRLEISSKLSLLRARNIRLDDWLILMPADRWSNTVLRRFKDAGKFSAVAVAADVTTVFAPRVPSDRYGKVDYKPPPGTYTLVNLDASANVELFHTPFRVGLGIRNLLNTVYRDYLNSFRYYTDEMGRNIELRLGISIEKFLYNHSHRKS